MTGLRSYLDLIIASIVVVVAVFASSWAFQRVVEMEKPQLVLVSSFPRTGQKFYLTDGERCFGTLLYTINKEQAYTASFAMRVRVKAYDQVITPLLTVEAYFNPLGQLSESTSRLLLDSGSIQMGTSGIAPMDAHLTTKLPDVNFDQHFALPGPIVLQEVDKQAYSLSYISNSPESLEVIERMSAGLPSSFPLSLRSETSSDLPRGCAEDKTSNYDLTPLLQLANGFPLTPTLLHQR